MRHALAFAALASALLVAAGPTQAQPRGGAWRPLSCEAGQNIAVRAEIGRLPAMTEAPTDSEQRLCVTEIRLSSPAPFSRLIVFQVQGSYWCGTAGCSTFIYGADPYGVWTDISPQDTLTNAQSEEIRVNTARAFRGMPRLAIRTGGGGAGPGVAEWGWIPRLNRYSE